MGTWRKQGRAGTSKACRLAERHLQILVIAGDIGIYVMVINIIDCILLTANLMKYIIMKPILRCYLKMNVLLMAVKKLNILKCKVQRQQIKWHSFTPYLQNNSLNAMASNQESRPADERQYFRRHGLTNSAELHSTQTI